MTFLFGYIYWQNILWSKQAELPLVRGGLLDTTHSVLDIDAFQLVGNKAGIAPSLWISLLIGLRQYLTVLIPCGVRELIFIFSHSTTGDFQQNALYLIGTERLGLHLTDFYPCWMVS